jgi:hypothetical protein
VRWTDFQAALGLGLHQATRKIDHISEANLIGSQFFLFSSFLSNDLRDRGDQDVDANREDNE